MADFAPGFAPRWGSLVSGTLNDANLTESITTTKKGSLCWIGISLENMANGDDFEIELNRWDGSAWRLYKEYKVTKAAGVISIDTGGGAVAQKLDEINIENILLDLVRSLQLTLTRISGTDRDFPFFYNKLE